MDCEQRLVVGATFNEEIVDGSACRSLDGNLIVGESYYRSVVGHTSS